MKERRREEGKAIFNSHECDCESEAVRCRKRSLCLLTSSRAFLPSFSASWLACLPCDSVPSVAFASADPLAVTADPATTDRLAAGRRVCVRESEG